MISIDKIRKTILPRDFIFMYFCFYSVLVLLIEICKVIQKVCNHADDF